MFDILIFSKNRACQLDLFLRTMNENFFVNKNVFVLYTFTNDEYKKGYNKLIYMHPNIYFILEEISFRDSVLNIVNQFKNEFCIFFTDDDIFIRGITDKLINNILNIYNEKKDVHSISLRMNPKINYCFPARKHINPPDLFFIENTMIWNWTKAEDQHCCWGYPMSLTSHIYETNKIKELFNRIDFKNPNNLEALMNCNRFKNKPYIISFLDSKVFNVQNNFVKSEGNYSDKNVKELNDLFLNNKRIDIKSKIPNTQCHGEIEYYYV